MRMIDLADVDLDHVEHHAGGWLSQIVTTGSTIHHGRSVYSVRWRDGAPRCCPTSRMGRWGTECAPVIAFDGHDNSTLQGIAKQCGTCGTLHFAPVRVTELEAVTFPTLRTARTPTASSTSAKCRSLDELLDGIEFACHMSKIRGNPTGEAEELAAKRIARKAWRDWDFDDVALITADDGEPVLWIES